MKVQWIGLAHGTETSEYDFDNLGLSNGDSLKFRTDTESKTGDGVTKSMPLIAVLSSGNPDANKPCSASRLIVRELISSFRHECRTEQFSELYYDKWLRFTFAEIRKTLLAYGEENPEYYGFSASCTCIIIDNTIAYVAQLGNTHLYQMRNKCVTDLSKEDILNSSTEEYFFNASRARQLDPNDFLKTTVGALDQEPIEPHIFITDIQKNDILGLCTEGLDTAVGEDGFQSFLQKAKNLSGLGKAARRMINEGGKLCNDASLGTLLLRIR